MRLYLVRHGETVWNIESRIQGWSDQPLSTRGIEQAKELRQFFSDIDIDFVYCSDLQRASKTAQLITDGKCPKLHQDSSFKEMFFGDLEGLREREINERFPGVLESLRADPGNYIVPGGESLLSVQKRAWKALSKIVKKHPEGTGLLVAHHSVNKALLCKLLEIPLKQSGVLRQPPCAISIIEFFENLTFVHAINLNWQERGSVWLDLDLGLKNRVLNASAFIFDMDGVLLDSMPSYAAAWRSALAEWGVFPPEIELLLREGEKAEKSIEYFFQAAGKTVDLDILTIVKERVQQNYANYPTAKLYDDATELLERLKNDGRRIALVTGSPRQDIERLRDQKQLPFFDVTISGDDVKKGKPDPEPYKTCLRMLGLKEEEVVVIENSPFGVRSAKKAGLLTIALTSTLPRKEFAEADLVIDSLRRLIGWLDL